MVVMNVGFGTTGTRTVSDESCKHHAPCCHWKKCIPHDFGARYLVLHHFMDLQECLRVREPVSGCETQRWMDKLRPLIKALMVSGIRSLGDNPTQFFYREYLDLAPHLAVQHSVRDPFTWVLKRVAEHDRNDILCDMRLPVNRNVSTPFHVLECMRGSQYVYERLTVMAEYMRISGEEAKQLAAVGYNEVPAQQRARIEEVAAFYADFNRRVLDIVGPRNRYQPICVWDGDFP